MAKYVLFLLLLIPIATSLEGIIFTNVAIHMDPIPMCNETVLEMDGINHIPICTNFTSISEIILTYNGTHTTNNNQNISLTLIISSSKENYTGVLVTDRSFPNTLKMATVTLEPQESATTTTTTTTTTTLKPPVTPITTAAPTTPAPKKEAHLTIQYFYMKNEVTEKVNKNGSAVTVAVIEGLVLIAILAYFGYKTMKEQKRKQTANVYGYDNNAPSRITVPDTIRMSDIPPPRDTNYATPPTIPPLSQRTMVSSPDLVVPSTTANSTNSTNHTTSSQNQFSDPFASLDSW